jgi:hypothetical protein
MVTRLADLSKRTVRPVDSSNWRAYRFWMLASTTVVTPTEVCMTLELPERATITDSYAEGGQLLQRSTPPWASSTRPSNASTLHS